MTWPVFIVIALSALITFAVAFSMGVAYSTEVRQIVREKRPRVYDPDCVQCPDCGGINLQVGRYGVMYEGHAAHCMDCGIRTFGLELCDQADPKYGGSR